MQNKCIYLLVCTVFGVSTLAIESVRQDQDQGQIQSECVIILHGLGRSSGSMDKLAGIVKEKGYQVFNSDYDSRSGKIEVLAKKAIEPGLQWCHEKQALTIHFITHSMGGILVRYYYQERLLPEFSRIVMLAPPNKGSEIAELLMQYYLYKKLTGPAGQQLGTDEDSLLGQMKPINAEIGIIAGSSTVDPWFSPFLNGANDGKVMVKDTMLDEMKDFIVVEHSHTFIMKSSYVISQISHFLANGIFDRSIQDDQTKEDKTKVKVDAK